MTRFVLAPLAEFTDAPFRRLCAEGGADIVYTEMVSAAGLAHGSTHTLQMLETMPGEGRTACQIFGADERDVAAAAALVQRTCRHSFCELNLNAGCPMAKVTRTGAGAKLIEDPARIGRLLAAMAENTDLPVTLKTRLGPRPGAPAIFEILDAAEQAGAGGIVVHARYTSQMHSGATDLETLAEVVRRARMPVTGNGSVVDAKSAEAMAATGVSAIMVGRAAMKEPDVYRRLASGLPPPPPDPARARRICRCHLDYVAQFRDRLARRFPGCRAPSADALSLLKMRTHLFRYFGGCPGAAALRARIGSIRTLAELDDLLRVYPVIASTGKTGIQQR